MALRAEPRTLEAGVGKEADARATTKAVFQVGRPGPYTEPPVLGAPGAEAKPRGVC